MRHRIFQGFAWAAVAALMLSTACVDNTDGSITAGSAPVYLYDGGTTSVLVWKDVSTLYDLGNGGTAPAADRTLNGTVIATIGTLAWGGMALDTSIDRLYLVSATGTLVRVKSASTQSGAPSTSDAASFNLTRKLTDSTFGQISAQNSYLYLTEYTSSESQIWVIPASALESAGGTITSTTSGVSLIAPPSAENRAYGLAVLKNGTASANLFAYFEGGNSYTDTLNNKTYSNQRIRCGGASSGFLTEVTKQVIWGSTASTSDSTRLGKWGCLALDYMNDDLFVAVHNTDAGKPASTGSVLVFATSAFSSTDGLDRAPDRTLAGGDDLRIIAHAGSKDWLLGANGVSAVTSGDPDTGTNKLWIWKAPSAGDTHVTLSLGSNVLVQGLALDGSQ